ncbi:MAG: hypothetical protein ACHQ1E_05230, partial [Ktedonobacterales bacterium]
PRRIDHPCAAQQDGLVGRATLALVSLRHSSLYSLSLFVSVAAMNAHRFSRGHKWPAHGADGGINAPAALKPPSRAPAF